MLAVAFTIGWYLLARLTKAYVRRLACYSANKVKISTYSFYYNASQGMSNPEYWPILNTSELFANMRIC